MKQFLICYLLFMLPVAVWSQTTLQQRIDALITSELSPESEVGIAVYDLTAKHMLYTYRADKLSRPASTMKLLTAITCLAQSNRDEPFATDLYYDGYLAGDTLHGNVYVVGGFDPEFGEEHLMHLVGSLQGLQIKVIDGAVFGDVSMKDSLYWGSGWSWDDSPASFQPYLSPLMYNKDMVSVTVTPGAHAGDPAQVECAPPSSYYTVTNLTVTHDPSAGKANITRHWMHNSNEIRITGNIDAKYQTDLSLFSSQDYFMCTFIDRLQAAGITVTRPYAFREFVADHTAVHRIRVETPMQDALDRLMKESDNLNGEAFLCRLAVHCSGHRHVSAEDGLEAIRTQIGQLGYDPKQFKVADGCGLSNYNLISPMLLLDFLRFAYADTEIFRRLYKSLPIAGIDGTLQHRMKKTPAYRQVHAKTGTFTGISTLAGYLHTRSGHDVAFAIMNQNFLSGATARALQDKICALLCRI